MFAPNIPSAIEHIKVLGPPDIERIIGITGGNIFHGEILPDQMFGYRPVPGYSDYRTPVDRLYLCGSGAWPGGAVFGAPGRNCALEALPDLAGVPPRLGRPPARGPAAGGGAFWLLQKGVGGGGRPLGRPGRAGVGGGGAARPGAGPSPPEVDVDAVPLGADGLPERLGPGARARRHPRLASSQSPMIATK